MKRLVVSFCSRFHFRSGKRAAGTLYQCCIVSLLGFVHVVFYVG